MTRSPPWNDDENRALVSLYFAMLDKAVAGQPYNKAAMVREATGRDNFYIITNTDAPLIDRTKQSIEFKLMNASAAHAALDPHADTMDTFGYRAMPNYQASLKDAMQAEIYRRQVGAHNVGTCKHCGKPYRYNNLSWQVKGYCSPDCLDLANDHPAFDDQAWCDAS